MKKLVVLMVAALMVFSASPGWSLPYSLGAPIDSIVAYGQGSPSEAAEKGYLATYLGLTIPQMEALYIYTKDNGVGAANYKQITLADNYPVNFAWDYAIVKVDGPNDYWYLFTDDNSSGSLLNGDNKLVTPLQGTLLDSSLNPDLYFNGLPTSEGLGISHVSFFTTTAVPEPLTMLLLGLGLVGLAGVGRSRK